MNSLHAQPIPSPQPQSSQYDPIAAQIVATQAFTTIEADDPGIADAGYESDSPLERETSLSSSIRDYAFENGRRYHKFREGAYQFPNDEHEQDRENMKHAMIVNLCGGKLHFAPIGEYPQNIIDLGTGTGAWCMDMGDEYPSAQILGVDLSPIQPVWVPPNVRFMVDDVESPWLESENFYDLVHCRHTTPAIKDFPALLKRAYDHIKPGGWIEFQEMHHLPHCDDVSMPADFPLLRFFLVVTKGLAELGVDLTSSLSQTQNLTAYGFTNVQHQVMKIPVGTWPKNPTLKTIGLYAKVGILEGLQAMSFGPLCRGLGWNREEVEGLLADVRRGFLDSEVHSYLPFHVVCGQKPVERGMEQPDCMFGVQEKG